METINPFKDQNVEILDFPIAEDSRFGSSLLNSAKELQIGNGSKVFRGDKSGIWLGASRFADAPFSVDMQGNVIATGLTLGSLSGTLDDIANGTTYKKTTASEVLGAGRAYTGLNTAGEIIQGFLSSQLSSKSLPYTGVRVDNNGIYGTKSGSVTFYINASTGDATFSGDVTGATITGGTITGSTLKTQSSGQRIELSSSFMGFYDSSNNNTATMYAGSNSVKIQYGNSNTVIQLDCGTSGAISFMSGGSQKFLYSDSQNGLYPYSNSSIDLGVYARSWRDLWLNSVGSVGASGTQGSSFPSGWSVSKIATGRYQITHNYDSYDYVVNVTVVSSVAKIWSIESKSNNTFNVRIANTSFTLEDNDFDFIVIRN